MDTSDRESDRARPEVDDGGVREYVAEDLLGSQFDDLDSFTERRRKLYHPVRFSILYYMYKRTGGDDQAHVPRTELKRVTGRERNDLQNHVRPLMDVNLIAEIPGPEDADGRKTYYRITTLGKDAIESAIRSVTSEASTNNP